MNTLRKKRVVDYRMERIQSRDSAVLLMSRVSRHVPFQPASDRLQEPETEKRRNSFFASFAALLSKMRLAKENY